MSRLTEARKVAQELLETLESSQSPIEMSLMKAKRLARLMRDPDAQTWLDLETRGYPDNFYGGNLGTCLKYVTAAGRFTDDGKYYSISLPKLEAQRRSDEAQVEALRTARPPAARSKDFLETRATEALLTTQVQLQNQQKMLSPRVKHSLLL